MSEVKAGQWWTEKGSTNKKDRILVRGTTSAGKVICEWADGDASSTPLDYFLKYKDLLPECTGWDWEPEPARPKTRTVKVHTVMYGISPQLGRNVMSVLDTELAGFKRDWKYVQVLKTEEYEVPCE